MAELSCRTVTASVQGKRNTFAQQGRDRIHQQHWIALLLRYLDRFGVSPIRGDDGGEQRWEVCRSINAQTCHARSMGVVVAFNGGVQPKIEKGEQRLQLITL